MPCFCSLLPFFCTLYAFFDRINTKMRVCHKSMAHPLLYYLLHNPRSIVAYSKKGIILYRLQFLLFPIFSIINRQEVHKRA